MGLSTVDGRWRDWPDAVCLAFTRLTAIGRASMTPGKQCLSGPLRQNAGVRSI